jgi:3'-5' exoribonuclease
MKIADLTEDKMPVLGLKCLVMSCEEREARNGNGYLAGILADTEGLIDFKIWDNVPIMKTLMVPGKAIQVTQGMVEEYKGKMSVKIASAAMLDDSEVENYIPTSYMTAEEVENEVLNLLPEEIRTYNLDIDPIIESLKKMGIINDFLSAPAGIRMHHAYRRGLITHSIEIVNLARSVAQTMLKDPGVKLDMGVLLTAALFHDVGKLLEYEKNDVGLFLGFTPNGHLQGHSFIGAAMLNSILHKKLPKDRLINLTHCLISHHGNPDWGAAVPPKTAEALILHHCDMLSSHTLNKCEQSTDIFGK